MPLNKFLNLLEIESECTIKSVFGNTGIFYRGAMFAQVNNQQVLLRGCGQVTPRLKQLGCKPYIHKKKRTESMMNYFDVSQLIDEDDNCIRELATCAYQAAFEDRQAKEETTMSKLRELPNMSHRLERMLSRCGVDSVEAFKEKGAVPCYIEMCNLHGLSVVTLDVLFKLYGAIHHIHWQLVSEEDKQHLMDECRKQEWQMGLRRFDY